MAAWFLVALLWVLGTIMHFGWAYDSAYKPKSLEVTLCAVFWPPVMLVVSIIAAYKVLMQSK